MKLETGFSTVMALTYYEFFAGGGMVREGLGRGWHCLFANDIDPHKAKSYRANFDPAPLVQCDINTVTTAALEGHADLAWASFPCQDLSLAGAGTGLKGTRSGAFWCFWRLIEALNQQDRAPTTITLENVPGLVTSNQGRDLAAIIAALTSLDYVVAPMIIDAALFVPQSRPRLFVIGIKNHVKISPAFLADDPAQEWTTPALIKSVAAFPTAIKNALFWPALPMPPKRNTDLASMVEWQQQDWDPQQKTDAILAMMDTRNKLKVEAAKRKDQPMVGAVFKRTRLNKDGQKSQRAEIRFDGLAGCLRTPSGGSSRQTLLFVRGQDVRSRLISPRESARLMGLPDSYVLPKSNTQAYCLTGDGVCVPVVQFLKETLIEPLLSANRRNAA